MVRERVHAKASTAMTISTKETRPFILFAEKGETFVIPGGRESRIPPFNLLTP
jgi:hypothetical protein